MPICQFFAGRCAVLKYTEYGGYYIDQRVRLVDAALIIDAT